MTGELVKIQMKKKDRKSNKRIAENLSVKQLKKILIFGPMLRNKEEPIRMRAREIAIKLKLEMKISDVEFQGDGSKIYVLLYCK